MPVQANWYPLTSTGMSDGNDVALSASAACEQNMVIEAAAMATAGFNMEHSSTQNESSPAWRYQ
jgi:hypothetical protein